MGADAESFWAVELDKLLGRLGASHTGLGWQEARARLDRFGPNRLGGPRKTAGVWLLLGQFKSPVVLILIFAACLSVFLRDVTDAVIILAIVTISALLGFWQERGATRAVQGLLETVRASVTVLRDGAPAEVPAEDVVPGDVVVLSAGSSIPADCRLLEAKDLFVDEATLTGETFPVEKAPGTLPPDTPLGKRGNALFMGTHAVSGSGKAMVVVTGRRTQFGGISEHLKLRPPETEFERGIRRFGYLLMEITLILLIAIFAINVLLRRPVLEAFLFSLALAVGLTPQLLPAIISVNLAHGARRMAQAKVIVRRLASIENFGSIDVLCSDKTGTLTEGTVRLDAAVDISGQPSERVLLHAYLNSANETGFANPVDEAIRRRGQRDISDYGKLDEVPYDFVRRRLSVLLEHGGRRLMITKGAFRSVLGVCTSAEASDGHIVEIASVAARLEEMFAQYGGQGLRALAVASRDFGTEQRISKEHEAGMTFLGFLLLSDPPKRDVPQAIEALARLGVGLKMVTGDNVFVAQDVARKVGIRRPVVLTGADIRGMSDEAMVHRASRANIFAEVEPNQKERIVRSLQKAGHVVAYTGDGINDASALHAADVGISVNTAVNVAKEAADIVLLEKDLGVLAEGIRQGRATFANTLKYVFMATSANFGNMFSMAGASLFLPFLPLLPKQVLLLNLMTDFPEMTIATDSVDADMVRRPRRWDVRFIRRFMVWFGLLSSVFDYLAFGVLLLVLRATDTQFRTAWFVESAVSACLVVLVIRTPRAFFKSMPGKYLMVATLAVVAAVLVLPYVPVSRLLGFEPLPLTLLLPMLTIAVLYMLSAEAAKRLFYRRTGTPGGARAQ